MRFAYADPPYLAQAARHYRDGGTAKRKLALNPNAAEVDHAELIARLCDEYADGWGLSASSPSLRELLPLCPADVRVMAWVKPFAVFKPNVGVAYAWEPVIVRGGRKRSREQATVRDWVSAVITLRKGMVGAKPPAFCSWLLDVLGYEDGDTLDDIYPGTGIMGAVAAQGRIAL